MKFGKNNWELFVSLLFLGFLTWWVSFQRVVESQGPSVQWFGGTYGVLALIGAVFGFVAARKWGGFKTVLGKSLSFFTLGLLLQEAGQLILTYYIYGAKVQTPYPSWGDVAYFGSTLSYITGAIFLAKAAGIRFSLKNTQYKFIAFLVPAVLLVASYWVFLHNHAYDWHKPLTVFLDIGYPFGDASYISMAIIAYVLSRKLLGGVMRTGIMIVIFALFIQYIADWSFLYQSSRGNYVAGRYVDLAYLVAYFVMASAMVKFYYVYSELRNLSKEDSRET